ncbi:MAG: hypothetical protein R3233_01360 [Xanthomonadales bacterium]|nr:hypothetical protein [Xanthomonadales bacterium]
MKPWFLQLRHRVRIPNLLALATAALLIVTSAYAPGPMDAERGMLRGGEPVDASTLLADAPPEPARDRKRTLRHSLLLLLPRG